MSFWDNLGNSLSEGSSGLFQKIKDETGAVSLRAENASAERKARSACEEIGRLLAEGSLAQLSDEELEAALAQEDAPDARPISLLNWREIYAMTRVIREQRRLIRDNEARIISLTGAIVCPGCGKMVGKKSAFCPDCGTKLEWPKVPEPTDDIMDGEFVQTDAVHPDETPQASEEMAEAVKMPEQTASEAKKEQPEEETKPSGEEESSTK